MYNYKDYVYRDENKVAKGKELSFGYSVEKIPVGLLDKEENCRIRGNLAFPPKPDTTISYSLNYTDF